MKTINSYLMLIASTILLFSCENHNIQLHTIINEDGSCVRQISYSNKMPKEMRDSLWNGKEGDSYPIPDNLNIDTYKKISTEIGKEDTVTSTFMKSFDSVQQMCKETPLQLNGKRLQSNATLEKHFRWFYTEYTFTETFRCLGDSFKLPATNYADSATVNYWFTGQPNLIEGLSGAEAFEKISQMETSINKWLNDNYFQICFDFIVSYYDSINNPPVNRERFIQLHDTLSTCIMKNDQNTFDEVDKSFKQFFHSDAYTPFFDEDHRFCKELQEKIMSPWNIFMLSFSYTLQMPGKVVDTGIGTYQDGIIYYPITGERLIPKDYIIQATSQVTNIWAYVVTILIILIAIGSWLYRR